MRLQTEVVLEAIESAQRLVYPAEIARVTGMRIQRVQDVAAQLWRDGRVSKLVLKRGNVPMYASRDMAPTLPPSVYPHVLDLKPQRNAEREQLLAKLRRQGPTKINLERIRHGRSVFDWGNR